MYWEQQVVELQKYAPVTLSRPDGRWFAVWEALVRIGDDPPKHWPSEQGQTPAAAVIALWERMTGLSSPLTIYGESIIRVRWNGRWHEEAVSPEAPESKIDFGDCPF